MTNFAALSRRHFKPEVKLQIVQDALKGTLSKAAVARKYNVNANQVCRWVREFRAGARWVPESPVTLLPAIVDSTEARECRAFNDSSDRSECSNSKVPAGPVIQVHFNSGHQLVIDTVTPSQLKMLIEALK